MNTYELSNRMLEKLAERLAKLDEDAFVEFSSIFGPRLRAFFIRKGLKPSDSEDLTITCLSDIALRVRQHYKPSSKGSFCAWIFTLAYRTFVDWLRKQPEIQAVSGDVLLQIPFKESYCPDMNLIWAIQTALDQLSNKEREIIELRDLGIPLSYEEIGVKLDISSGNARLRHLRAIRKLKEILKKDEELKQYLAQLEPHEEKNER